MVHLGLGVQAISLGDPLEVEDELGLAPVEKVAVIALTLLLILPDLDAAVPLALVLGALVRGVVPAGADETVFVLHHELGPLVHMKLHEGLAVRETG